MENEKNKCNSVNPELSELSEEECMRRLLNELQEGERSGNEEGWIPAEKVRDYFRREFKSSEEPK